MPRPFRLLAVAFLALLALSACNAGPPPAATVDGQSITDVELERGVALFRFLTELSQQPCGQPDTSIGESEASACTRFTLSNLIQQDLVSQYAAAHGIQPDADRVSDAIEQLEQNLGGRAALEDRLTRSGVTRQELLALARRLILFGDVQRAIGAESVSDESLREAYEQQARAYTQLHARHILVETRAQAERIAREATQKNFAELAREHSIDPGSAKNGGDLGTVPASQFDQTFVDAALALRPGEISRPVQTQVGWHVIQLVSAEVPPLREVRDQLAGPLEQEAFARWLQQRSRDADITVNPRYGRYDPETGDIVPIRSTARQTSSSPSAASSASP
jgi:foldase protein PrsA